MVAKLLICVFVAFAFFAPLNANVAFKHEQDDCPQICPLMYAPVCGTDGVNFREFSNSCELKAINCRKDRGPLKPFLMTALDMCRTEYVPSLDKLLVKLGNVNLAKAECLKPCVLIYQPVCISNGKLRFMASNTCMMETINCALDNQDTFDILQYGKC